MTEDPKLRWVGRLFAGVHRTPPPHIRANAAPLPRAAHEKEGRQRWLELHSRALDYPERPTAVDERQLREWLARWSRRLPRYGCGCSPEWAAILRLSPPPMSSRADFYWWTVAAHDRINRRLGKPIHAPAWSLAHPLLQAP